MPAAAITCTPSSFSPAFVAEEASRFSASEIREAIANCVGENRLDLADALVAAGISQYPYSEDILALAALVAEVQQDWQLAHERLQVLLQLQGSRVTAETLHHFVRVLSCRHAHFEAYLQAKAALTKYPHHQGLRRSYDRLKELMESVPVSIYSTPDKQRIT